jgi:hydrogenase-4 component F
MPPALLWPAFLLILVGFGTKVNLVPTHTWLPDAHSQAPASICALLSGVETTTVLYLILRLFLVVGVAPGLDARPWFIGFGPGSVGVATLLLIYVRDFKPMLRSRPSSTWESSWLLPDLAAPKRISARPTR